MDKYGVDARPNSAGMIPGHLAPSRFMGLGNHRGHVLVSSDETNGALVLASLEADPEGGLQPHLHRLEEEVFYVLEGRFRVRLGDRIIEAVTGDLIFAPRGTVHCWSNVGDAPAYALVLIAPAENFQNFAVELEKLIDRISEDGVGSPGRPTAQMQEEIAGLYQRHSMELLSPDEVGS
jgi:quercetin dioxygenase-like cupin family protein